MKQVLYTYLVWKSFLKDSNEYRIAHFPVFILYNVNLFGFFFSTSVDFFYFWSKMAFHIYWKRYSTCCLFASQIPKTAGTETGWCLKFNPGLPHRWQGPRHWGYHPQHPSVPHSRKLVSNTELHFYPGCLILDTGIPGVTVTIMAVACA